MLLKGAQIIIECLKEQGVDTVFGYPGGTVLPVYDALYTDGQEIRHVLTSHEQGAAHAADGYARATGKTGVCLVTSGPGATNLVTGIATAYMDSVPMVAITINVSTGSLGKDSFQEVDIAGITMPVTKHNFIVKDIGVLAKTLRRAFKIAGSGRKGPVLVDITKDVTENTAEYEKPGFSATLFEQTADGANGCAAFHSGLDDNEKERLFKLLKGAKTPLLLVGGGCVASNAQAGLLEFERLYPIPVADTLMGKGAYPGDADEYMGMVGVYGTEKANAALSQSDLIIALGCRFSERVLECEAFPKDVNIIQIDIDRAELNKNITDTLAICSDIDRALSDINSLLSDGQLDASNKTNSAKRRTWLRTCKDRDKTEKLPEEDVLTGEAVIRTIFEQTKGNAIIATEVGLNQMLAARYYTFTRGRQLLTSGGLGTMGYGLSAAIGAQIGCPDELVINIAGDGCFRMNMNELLTAKANKLPIIEIILDNRMLGMVHELQRTEYDGRFIQTEYTDMADYEKISAACGAVSSTVTKVSELKEAVKKAIKDKQLTVIVCRI